MRVNKALQNETGQFQLAYLQAEVESETESSICLRLMRWTDSPANLPVDAEWLFADSNGPFLEEVGWLDVHYPCAGVRKAFLRISIPPEYHDVLRIQALTTAVFEVLSIPDNVLSSVDYFSSGQLHCILPRDELGRG